jgi:hypothetical protein
MTNVEVNQVYPEFIEEDLKIERERRANLDSRGATILTQSGTLCTLLVGVAAFARGSGGAHLSGYALVTVIVSAALLVGACIVAILVSSPYLFDAQPVAAESTYQKMVTEKRTDTEANALAVVGMLRTGTLGKLRKGNNLKVQLVF